MMRYSIKLLSAEHRTWLAAYQRDLVDQTNGSCLGLVGISVSLSDRRRFVVGRKPDQQSIQVFIFRLESTLKNDSCQDESSVRGRRFNRNNGL